MYFFLYRLVFCLWVILKFSQLISFASYPQIAVVSCLFPELEWHLMTQLISSRLKEVRHFNTSFCSVICYIQGTNEALDGGVWGTGDTKLKCSRDRGHKTKTAKGHLTSNICEFTEKFIRSAHFLRQTSSFGEVEGKIISLPTLSAVLTSWICSWWC